MLGCRVITNLLRNMLISFIVSPKRLFLRAGNDYFEDDDEGSAIDNKLPQDVKEGHFVVHTFYQGELSRFVLELGFLDHPDFLKILQQAEEEFGFKTKGVLAVPCGPDVLQMILEKKTTK